LKGRALPKRQVAGAAFGLRYRAIIAQKQKDDHKSKIEAARASGADWVTLQSTGLPASGLMDPYSEIEMHLATGLALVCREEFDLVSNTSGFVVSVVRLDPEDGTLLVAEPGVADWNQHPDWDSCVAACSDLRARIASGQTDWS